MFKDSQCKTTLYHSRRKAIFYHSSCRTTLKHSH
uniref:Uncharacterized protein n=1 Tax=Anguilla anguilla TaxID=7936 RepID=A0A0E9QPL6_ANGAN